MNVLSGKNVRIFILGILDVCIVIVSAIFALATRFDMSAIPPEYMDAAIRCMPVYAIIAIVVMAAYKLYNRVWTYASLSELFKIFKASVIIEVLIIVYHVFRGIDMPRSYYPLDWLFLFILFTAVRFAKMVIKNIRNSKKAQRVTRKIMVVGAGAAASILIKDINGHSGNSKIVCAIDDNRNKKNKYIHDIPIVGDRHDIIKSVEDYEISEIIIAMPSVSPNEIKDIIEICQETRRPVKILPSVSKSLTTSLAKELRPVNYEDLLGREPIFVNQEGLNNFINGKVVMVTGGGGSIGSELCRQIIRYNPKKLIIFDIYENNAYDIQMELERHYPQMDISTLIGSIRDYDKMECLFAKYKPNIIYHAAAHKHVPLMEKSPNEAIKNNCLGTLNLVKLADKYKVDNFVLISTDKAVRPTSLMGATKRICEMIIQTYAKKSEHTRFAAVRFGNVLGSNGSVIPLFLNQIEEGGPVTVTHKDIVRFFMTIPEAVSLVLQASLFAHGGEIFVLDMGKPVKIYELAENLIKMKGYRPNEDIDIEIVGLRPGEKLYEEILMDEEGLDKTENNMIYIGKPLKIDEDEFLDKLDELIDESFKNGYRIKEKTQEVCDTYTITDN